MLQSYRGVLAVPAQGTPAVPEQGMLAVPEQGTPAVPERGTLAVPEQGTLSTLERGTPVVLEQGTLAVLERGARAVPEQGTLSTLERGIPVVPEQGTLAVPEQSMPTQRCSLRQQVPRQDGMLLLAWGFAMRRPPHSPCRDQPCVTARAQGCPLGAFFGSLIPGSLSARLVPQRLWLAHRCTPGAVAGAYS